MTATTYKLSAIVIIGSLRERGQMCVDALNHQTIAKDMEVIVIDTRINLPALKMTGDAKHIYIQMPDNTSWCDGRYEGFLRATSPIVAFIEDHCFASSTWAEALIDVYKHNWASVGYGFKNANPQTYLSRAAMFLDYGSWQVPAVSRITKFLPGNNISYRRDIILKYGERLKQLLEIDFNLHTQLLNDNHKLYSASDAVVYHQNFDYLGGNIFACFAYSRALAHARAKINSWSFVKRLIYACGTPFVSPPIRIFRLINSFQFKPDKTNQVISLIKSFPLLIITLGLSGIGEAIGYITLRENPGKSLFYWEVEAKRLKHYDAN